jgi:hypothetical protein
MVKAFTAARTAVDDLRNQLTKAVNDLNARGRRFWRSPSARAA